MCIRDRSYAVTCEHGAVVSLLLAAGADPDAADDDGDTPRAAASGAIRALIDAAAR